MPVAMGLTAVIGLLRRWRPKGGGHHRALEEASLLSRLRGGSTGVQAFSGMPRLYLSSDYTAVPKRAEVELGFRPKYDLKRGVRDVGEKLRAILEKDAKTSGHQYVQTVIDLDKHSITEPLVGDVCVIGTGIGGGSFVSSYLRSGGGLVIIEAGGEQDSDAVGLRSTGRDFGLAAYRDISIGGTSKTWRGVCAPMDTIDFAHREWITASGWPIGYRDLESYYHRASELLNLPAYEYFEDRERIDDARLHAEDFDFDRKSFTNKYFLQTRPPKFFHDDIFAWLPRRSDAVLVYNAIALELIMNREGTLVEKLLVKNNKGQTLFVQARKFIVCAGALETPRLLLNSRGTREAGLGNAHGHVGCYLMDHPMASISQIRLRKPRRASLYQSVNLTLTQHIKAGVVMNDEAQKTHQLPNHCVYLLPSLSRGLDDQYEKLRRTLILSRNKRLSLPDIAKLVSNPNTIHWGLSYLFPIDAYYRYADLYFISEQTPTQSSRVSLSAECDRFGYPIANVNWVISDDDLASVSKFNSLLLNSFSSSFYEVTDEKGRDQIKEAMYAAAHFMGTARMSAGIESGVVDADLKVWDVENLYICDGSVIPVAGNANPSLTIAALAIRLADHLARMRQGSMR
jgi:choline dehydrogenase-like flavoprotein